MKTKETHLFACVRGGGMAAVVVGLLRQAAH